jgi:uncharacterized protein YegL
MSLQFMLAAMSRWIPRKSFSSLLPLHSTPNEPIRFGASRSGWTIALCGASIAWLLTSNFVTATPADTQSASDYVVIVVDDSGSMREKMKRGGTRRIDAAKSALAKVIGQIPRETQLGVLLLNGARQSNHWLIPLGPVATQDALLAIQKLEPKGGTPLGEAMRLASDELLSVRSKNLYGTYRLIVVTDGEANDQALLEQYLPDILSRGVIVDAIGVDMRGDHSLATRVHSYRRADDQAALANAIVEILAENNTLDQAGNDADFELLQALDGLDSAELIKALATPNNERVTGIRPNASGANGSAEPSNGFPIGSASPTSGGTAVSIQTSFFSQLFRMFGAMCVCMIPMLFGILLFVILASNKTRR